MGTTMSATAAPVAIFLKKLIILLSLRFSVLKLFANTTKSVNRRISNFWQLFTRGSKYSLGPKTRSASLFPKAGNTAWKTHEN